MMNKKVLFFLTLFLTFFICSLTGAKSIQNKTSPSELPESYRKWLTEEVVYIITPKEKDVFLQLKTDRERNLFIEAFWKQRDPNANTPDNEFKTEHYRRISYANKYLGRGTPTPGWRTDMGKIYIILGEPKSIERYENLTEVYPSVIWFYQGMSIYGLPDSFNIVFFKKYGAGDYELYSPMKDGPQSLLIHYLGDPRDYLSAYSQLHTIQPELASVSLSLLPAEPLPAVTPSFSSDILLRNIDIQPQKSIKDQYAEKLLKYKDIIEVEYTANYMDNNSLVSVLKDPSGHYFVHYILEPEKLSVNASGSTYNTSLELSGQVSTLDGKSIYQFQKYIPIQFGEDQRKKMGSNPFRFQSVFPLIEGKYIFNLLLKNRISKEFTSIEAELNVPPCSSSDDMLPFVFAYHMKKEPLTVSLKPFKIGNYQFYPATKREFSQQDLLIVFFQIPDISITEREGAQIQFLIYRGEQKFYEDTKEISSYVSEGFVKEEISLKDFPPAHYKLEIKVNSKEHTPVFSGKTFFSVSPKALIPRPFIFSDLVPSPTDPQIDYVLGGQYFNTGQYGKAKTFLERAYRKKPNSLLFAEGLCRLLFKSGQYDEVQTILRPFTKEPQENYQFLKLLGNALQQLKQYEEAIDLYKQYLERYGTHLETLNAIGYCYLSLGKTDEALQALEKSLEINPNQEEIKKLVSSIKRKK